MILKTLSLFNKIANFGIRPELSFEKAEKMRLVNVISFLGVPICFFYTILFVITSHYFHAIVFFCGLPFFITPILLNSFKGLKLSIPVLTISVPIFWAIISIVLGRDTGFYLGFIVFCLPPVLFFPTFRESLFYLATAIILFVVSMIGMMIFPPVGVIPFAMGLFLINLFTVLATIIIITYFFKKELDESRLKVQEKNHEMLDSINYAKRIQYAMLPSESAFQKIFNDYFVYFKPKDIVAGDFYWMEEIDGKILIAAADCTGHGVPGALVSLVCHNALNRAVFEYKLSDPGEILDKTREFVIEHFSKTDEKVKDGMDISFGSIDKITGEIIWAGANNSLWYFQKGELKTILSNKQPIGISDIQSPFLSHKIQLLSGDSIYLFTDGYADQFGGEKGKKFKYQQLKELLLANAHLSMQEQKKVLDSAIETWKGKLEQVDDILIIGIKI
ncbi:MAG: SpoIIE family protein phosphatase [Bacteroidota bacterium]